jgi:hypothetical protein
MLALDFRHRSWKSFSVFPSSLDSGTPRAETSANASTPGRGAHRANEYGTCKTVKARFWPGLSAERPATLVRFPLFARKRGAYTDGPETT